MSDSASLLRTTGAVRRFLDRPVDDAVVHQVLDDARFAPSGGNRQPWRVAMIRDAAMRRELGDLMQHVWNDYVAVRETGRTPFNVIDGEPARINNPHVENELLRHIESIPVVLAIAADLNDVAMMDGRLNRATLTGGASVYPFCWSILQAARMRDLGGVMTTFLSRVEPVAGPVLGLPEDHALAATVFLGYPERAVTRLTRRPVEDFTTVDRFDGPAFV
jgi:nitroreductase